MLKQKIVDFRFPDPERKYKPKGYQTVLFTKYIRARLKALADMTAKNVI